MNERTFVVKVCVPCLERQGDMCHNPECRFCGVPEREVSKTLEVLGILKPGQPRATIDPEEADMSLLPKDEESFGIRTAAMLEIDHNQRKDFTIKDLDEEIQDQVRNSWRSIVRNAVHPLYHFVRRVLVVLKALVKSQPCSTGPHEDGSLCAACQGTAVLEEFLGKDWNTPGPTDLGKPVTVAELAKYVLGRPVESGADYEEAGLPMFGGCASCTASIVAFNAYPSRSGYLLCKDCIGNSGWNDLEEAKKGVFGK